MEGDNYYKSKIVIERYDRVDRNITSVAEWVWSAIHGNQNIVVRCALQE